MVNLSPGGLLHVRLSPVGDFSGRGSDNGTPATLYGRVIYSRDAAARHVSAGVQTGAAAKLYTHTLFGTVCRQL